MNMLQLDPPLPVTTPKGEGLAHVLIDYGAEHDLLWVVFQSTGDCWTWRNPEIRAVKNVTMGRTDVGIPDCCSGAEPAAFGHYPGGMGGAGAVGSAGPLGGAGAVGAPFNWY